MLQQSEPLFHKLIKNPQNGNRLSGFRDNRIHPTACGKEKIRQWSIHAKRPIRRLNQDKLQFLRRFLKQQGHDNIVQAKMPSQSSPASDKQMVHLSQIKQERSFFCKVFPYGTRQVHRSIPKGLIAKHSFQPERFDTISRDFQVQEAFPVGSFPICQPNFTHLRVEAAALGARYHNPYIGFKDLFHEISNSMCIHAVLDSLYPYFMTKNRTKRFSPPRPSGNTAVR